MQIDEHIEPAEIPDNIKLDEKVIYDVPKTPDFDTIVQGKSRHSYSTRRSVMQRLIRERLWWICKHLNATIEFWEYSDQFKIVKREKFESDDEDIKKVMRDIRTLSGIQHEAENENRFNEYDSN